MRKIFYFLLILLSSLITQSQNAIMGLVTDSSQSPLPFCPMVLLNAIDSSQVKGNISDSAGAFVFERVKPGLYFIKFAAVGYRSAYSSSFLVDSLSLITLPAQVLTSDGVRLEEVSVAAYKPAIEFKKGMVIMNVENDLLARGNTVLELIRRLPGVMVDAQNNITINGASGVRFMIDDRMQQMPVPQVMDMLAGMSADAVSKLELIKNPPARYDAAGAAGIINIVTKRAKLNGYNGSVGMAASQGKRLRVGPSGSFNYKNRKLSFFSNFSYFYFNGVDERILRRNMVSGTGTESINSFNVTEGHEQVFSGSGGIEYDISNSTLIGVYINGNRGREGYANAGATEIGNSSFFKYSRSADRISTHNNNQSPSLNFSLLHKTDTTGGQVKLRLGYNTYSESEANDVVNTFYDHEDRELLPVSSYNTSTRASWNVYTAKLDLNKTLKNKFSVEAGISANIEDDDLNTRLQFFNQSTGLFSGDTTFSNIYNFRQDVLAAYTTVSRNWDKFGFSAGVRAEETDVDIDYISNNYHYERRYLSIFPSGSLDYNFDKKNSFTLAYSYRIRRPHYRMLIPVRRFNEQLNYSVGNSEIRPQFSHRFNLDYNYNQFITVSASYDETKDFTFWYSYTPGSSRVKIDTISNLPRFTNAAITLSAQKRIKWYSFQTFWMATHQTFEGDLVGYDVSSRTYQFYFNLNQEIYLPGDWKIQVWTGRGSAIRHGPQVYLPRSAVHISINKSFSSQKLNITLGVNDVFYRDYFSYTTTYSDQDFYQRDRGDTRRVRVSVTYRFGKMQIQQRIKAEAGQNPR